MPHYKDGEEALLWDVVRGPMCNVKGERVGVLVSVHSRHDECNCCVAFIEVTADLAALRSGEPVQHFIGHDPKVSANRSQFVSVRTDYASLRDLSLVKRAKEVS